MKRAPLLSMLAALLLLAGPARAQEEAPSRPKPRPRTAHRKPKPAAGKQVSLNDASKAELKRLPGITDALAARIIAGRPYRTKAELMLRQILTADVYERIKHRVTGRPDKD